MIRVLVSAVSDAWNNAVEGSVTESVDGSKENVAPTDKCASPAVVTPNSATSLTTPIKAVSVPTTTTTYTVGGSDTLMSIAARYDTTPSELTKLNRLSTRYLFPGQSLLVPLKVVLGAAVDGGAGVDAGGLSPRPPRTPANSLDTDRALDQDCLERFLKIRVRHVTDGQGIVGGVLLVTPNAVMFDPDVSDPLVLERGGAESYGLIAPMDCVANAAIYSDIATMKVKDTKLPRPELPKPEIYYIPSMKTTDDTTNMDIMKTDLDGTGSNYPDVDSPLVLTKDATFPELNVVSGDCGKIGGASSTGSQEDDSSCSCGGETRDTSAFPKAFEHELLTPDTYPHSPLPAQEDSHEISTTGITSTSTPKTTAAAEEPHEHESLHETLSLQHSAHTLGTIEEDSTIASSTDNTITIGNTASRNVSCDSAVSVSSEVDLVLGPDGVVEKSSDGFDASSADQTVRTTVNMQPDNAAQATRKQKVLKRLSNPLSWMDSFSSDGAAGAGAPSTGGSNTPPILGGSLPLHQDQGGGVLSSVFSITSNVTSNVSNMLTRRPSLDLARRASPYSNQSPPLTQDQPQPTSAPPTVVHGGNVHSTQAVVDANQSTTSTQPGGGGDQKRSQYKDGNNFEFRSLVPMEDVSNLFTNVDKIMGRKQVEREEMTLYLCLRMGLPKTLPRSPFISYGSKTIKAEYWFSIPRSRASDLCRLLNLWSGGIYGEIDEAKLSERGLTLITEDTDLSVLEGNTRTSDGGQEVPGGADNGQQLKEITRESWEVCAPMSDDLRRALYSSSSITSLDVETFLPEMVDPSDVLDHKTYKGLYRKLPARLQGYSWRLAFSTSQHGFSLSSVYRKMQEIQDTPVMIAIQDTQQTIFGALVSNTLKVSEGFYGTGESFIFTCHPEFEVCNWTGENTYFIKGNSESLVIGGGENFGIWLDGDLYRGRSQPCKTYNNPVLGPSEDFVIKAIECWAFT